MHAFTPKAVLGLALLAAFATGANAQQDVSFTTLAEGNFAPGTPPAGQHVIRSAQELQALNLDQAINQPVDWNTETVIAVFMGTQSSGGYGISVDRITHEQLATILPVPGPPPAYLNTVYFSTRSPSGPAISVITSPFHVVKMRSRPGRFSFQSGGGITPPPPPPPGPIGNRPVAFTEALSSLGQGPRMAKTAAIRNQAELSQFLADWSGPLAPNVSVDFSTEMLLGVALGQSPAGRTVKITAVNRDDGSTTPPFPGFPTPMPPYIGTVTVSYEIGQNPTFTPSTSYPVTLVKVRRLPGSDQFMFLPGSGNLPFTELKLHDRDFSGGGSFAWTSDVTISASGDVSVLRSHPAAMVAPIYGQATAAEMRMLADAVRTARMSTLPNPLDVAIPMHLLAHPFTLTVDSPVSALNGQTSGQLGYYGQYDAKLRPLISQITSIKSRLMAEFGTQSVSGRVRLSGGQVVIQSGSDRYAVTNADQAQVLRRFRGRTVEVRGRATQVNGGSYELNVTRIVNPEPIDRGLMVYVENGDVKVFYDGGTRIAEGRLTRLMRNEDGNRVTLKGYAFRDASGDVESVVVTELTATATQFSTLRLSGQWAGYMRSGERVAVTRVSRSGRFARVTAANGDGYVRVSALRIGEPVPLFQPTVGGQPTTGLSGALGGN